MTHMPGIKTFPLSLYCGKIASVTPTANAPPICKPWLKSGFESVKDGEKLTATVMNKNKMRVIGLFLALERFRSWASTQ